MINNILHKFTNKFDTDNESDIIIRFFIFGSAIACLLSIFVFPKETILNTSINTIIFIAFALAYTCIYKFIEKVPLISIVILINLEYIFIFVEYYKTIGPNLWLIGILFIIISSLYKNSYMILTLSTTSIILITLAIVQKNSFIIDNNFYVLQAVVLTLVYFFAILIFLINKSKNERIENTANQLQLLVDTIPDHIFVADKKGNLQKVESSNKKNPPVFLLKRASENIFNLLPEKITEDIKEKLEKFQEIKEIYDFEHIDTSINDKKHYEITLTSLNENEVLVIVRDVTETKEYTNQMQFLSYHDPLTLLHNRRYFEQEINRLDAEANLPISLIMCDVNGLKLVNDSFGHEVGDRLLVEAANVIKNGCREEDVVVRIGGDEFAMLLSNTDQKEADKIIEAIKSNTKVTDNKEYLLSISFGYATKHKIEENVHRLFVEAENMMYNNKMYESSSMRSKTVDVIMNSLYEKSERELKHSKRVSELCYLIATGLKFSFERTQMIKTAGLLHDIGKIGVDEKILNKDGALSDKEWETIKSHPIAGWRILSSVKEFATISDYVLAHHERWAGGGYPNNLKGEEIPVESRILAVADAFDAMTSNRTYRKAMSHEDAFNELKKNAGTQFDPEIVKVFIKSYKKREKNFDAPR